MTPLALLCALLGAPPALPAASAYDAGRQAYQAQEFTAAKAHFEEALAHLPPGDPLRGPTLYNLARTTQQLGEPCAATTHFRVYLSTTADDPDEARRRPKAASGLIESEQACRATAKPPPPPPPSGPPDRLWAWVASGSAAAALIAGGVFVGAAAGDVTEADKAHERFLASGRRDTAERDAVVDARDSAEVNRAWGYTFLGVGAALAGVGAWLWLREPAGQAVSIRVGAGGAAAVWRF